MSKGLHAVTRWAFKSPENLQALLIAGSRKKLRNTLPVRIRLSKKEFSALWKILHNERGATHSTLINGRPILKEIRRLWLLTHHSPIATARIDPWKDYT